MSNNELPGFPPLTFVPVEHPHGFTPVQQPNEADIFIAAAYQELYQRFIPSDCTTESRLHAIEADLIEILNWAKDQNFDVRMSYAAAAIKVQQDAAERVAQITRTLLIAKARDELPKPPSRPKSRRAS